MYEKPKSTPELILEAEAAQRESEWTASAVHDLIERAREIGHRIENRVQEVSGKRMVVPGNGV